MKRLFSLLFLVLLLTGCTPHKQVYQVVYLDVFDTVSTIRGYDVSEKAFQEKADAAHKALLEYHRLFDIYHDCPDGIKAVNDNAGLSPVSVDAEVLALLKDGLEYCHLTDGRVNIAMGSVLSLWHEAREYGMEHPENSYLPDADALAEAAEHTSIDSLILNMDAGTAYLSDNHAKLDVGAIAKGWAAQKVSQMLPEGYLLNLGGNVCARGLKPDGTQWVIGVQSPEDPTTNVCTVGISAMSAVTSGDYQRSYSVDGISYHHIIDPDTRMPGTYWRSVTILCPDSGLADCLSTALFLMPLEEGMTLAEKCGAEVMWINNAGAIFQTDGF